MNDVGIAPHLEKNRQRRFFKTKTGALMGQKKEVLDEEN